MPGSTVSASSMIATMFGAETVAVVVPPVVRIGMARETSCSSVRWSSPTSPSTAKGWRGIVRIAVSTRTSCRPCAISASTIAARSRPARSSSVATPSRYVRHMTQSYVDERWDEIVPVLEEYIRIPNKSPVFDPDWEANGHMERAVELISTWLSSQGVEGLELFVHRLTGRTPVIVAEVPASDTSITGTVLLYGHLDKQPE